MKRILAACGGVLALLLAILLVRAATFPSQQPEVELAPPVEVDAEAVGRRLAEAVRFETISPQEEADRDRPAFLAFHRWLQSTYPVAHGALEREVVADLSLLYTWKGSRPELAPVLLLAHTDVVPVDPAEWTHPPFGGVIADGHVWGRGTIDDKGAIVCLLEAVERLVAEGFVPERTVLLAFGHDEEVGGDLGALSIAKLLESRGVRPLWVVDEGGVVARDFMPGLGAVAVIGIAEKGSVSIALTLEAPGGHSSTPPRHTAIGDLAAALTRLENHPPPANIDGTTALFFDHLGPELPFAARVVLANRWLFGPALRVGFRRMPPLDAMQRTTTALTIFEAGVKENVLPMRARAITNFRIHPSDDVESVTAHARKALDDERIELQVGVRSPPREASPVSPVDGEGFELLRRTIAQTFPDVVTVPYLVVGGTDARHYYRLTPNVYRFNPFVYGSDALKLAHGTDERISLENLGRAVGYFVRLLREGAGPGQSSSP